MAVRRVDAGAQPQSGIREPDLHAGHRRREPARRVVLGSDRPLAVRSELGAVEPQAAEPGLGESVVVVARHEHERAAGQRCAERLDERRGHLERLRERALAQLERVTQQHDPVVSTDRVDEPLAHARVAGHVRPAERAEMKVRDDRRAHARDGGSRAFAPGARQLDLAEVPTFCRHNRFTADCPICSKGTVLDPNLKPSRPRRTSSTRSGGARRSAAPAGATVSRGVFASAGPYEDGRELRLEKVPGGLRLAAWHAGQLVRAAPVLELRDLPGLLADAAEKDLLALPALGSEAEPSQDGQGTSPGRSGELRDELRVERLDGERLRIARWIMRPNRGWELQEAPVMLPPARFTQALEAAASAGALAAAPSEPVLPSDPGT